MESALKAMTLLTSSVPPFADQCRGLWHSNPLRERVPRCQVPHQEGEVYVQPHAPEEDEETGMDLSFLLVFRDHNYLCTSICLVQDSRAVPRHQNPVNAKTIRRPAFGMVGFTHMDIEMLKNKGFTLQKVPDCSPLHGGLEMSLTIHSESKVKKQT